MKIGLLSKEKAFLLAAEELCLYLESITGEDCILQNNLPAEEPFILLCDTDCEWACSSVKPYSDEYALISSGKNLVLTAGRGRAAFYAVYAFLETLGCRWFWDGDVVPKREELLLSGYENYESPRFETRAIRYFTHRGLHRFQAEHWGEEDWKREIHWILKKRLNTFMLRIGMDDLFQKAFPDVVPYPSNEEPLPEALKGYDDRTTFWSLEYRGKLRKKILDYAFERDLMHPEDCGAMTHWYSRTPLAFLEKEKPSLLAQNSASYSEKTGLVWDIQDERNWKNYYHLTDTHVKEYGRPQIFHTIGLAERRYGEDREKGMALKRLAYDKITEYVSKTYPDAPLWVASWDFFSSYQPEEVRKMMSFLDPDRHVILDYTVDLKAKENDFEHWGVVGKFPWIFGFFHAYEPQNHIHGDYHYLNEKMKVANGDPFCRGMAFWPETSHSDSLMLEYFTRNAWQPEFLSPEAWVKRFCEDRYGASASWMEKAWLAFTPLLDKPRSGGSYMECFFDVTHGDKTVRSLLDLAHPRHEVALKRWRDRIAVFEPHSRQMAATVKALAELPAALWENPLIRRDAIDLWRTVSAQKLDYDFLEGAVLYCDRGVCPELVRHWEACLEELKLFGKILSLSREFSLYHTLEGLKRESAVNPCFEETIKENAVNWYCRSAVYEAVMEVYVPEMRAVVDYVLKNHTYDHEFLQKEKERIFSEFKEKPLSQMKPEETDVRDVLNQSLQFICKE